MKKYLIVAIMIFGFLSVAQAHATIVLQQTEKDVISVAVNYNANTFYGVSGYLSKITINLSPYNWQTSNATTSIKIYGIDKAQSLPIITANDYKFITESDVQTIAEYFDGEVTYNFGSDSRGFNLPYYPQYMMVLITNNNQANIGVKGSRNSFSQTGNAYNSQNADNNAYGTFVTDLSLGNPTATWFFIMNFSSGFSPDSQYYNASLFPTSTSQEESAWNDYFNSSSSPFYVDCSGYSGTFFSSSTISGIICGAKKIGMDILKIMIVPPTIFKNYLIDSINAAKSAPPFGYIYQTVETVSSTITNANATSTTGEFSLTFPAPWNKITFYNTTTLDTALGSSTKNIVFDALKNLMWLGTGVSIIFMFL